MGTRALFRNRSQPSTLFNHTRAVIVDDSDSQLLWTSYWNISDGLHGNFNQTLHSARNAGSGVRLSFCGSFVAVYGTIGPKTIAPPISTYTLDDNLPINYTSPAAANWTSTQELYKSANLPPGQHTLNVDLISNNTWFSIDFFTYTPTPCAQSSTSSDMSEIHHPTHLAPGVVAAVVVTCIAFFSALFVSWVVWKRRKPRVDLRPQAYLVGRPQADSASSSRSWFE